MKKYLALIEMVGIEVVTGAYCNAVSCSGQAGGQCEYVDRGLGYRMYREFLTNIKKMLLKYIALKR